MHYVLVGHYTHLISLLHEVSSDRLAATGFSIVELVDFAHYWPNGVALHSQIGDKQSIKFYSISEADPAPSKARVFIL